jgi:hypothetical protein
LSGRISVRGWIIIETRGEFVFMLSLAFLRVGSEFIHVINNRLALSISFSPPPEL